MMSRRASHCFSLLLISSVFSCITAISAPPRGNSVLVVGETTDVQSTHSIVLQTLRDAGRQVTFTAATAKTIPIQTDGEYTYDAIILLAPRSTSLASKLSVNKLTSFIDSGRDLFLTSSSSYSSYTDKLAEAVGVDLDESDNIMYDYQRTVNDLNTNETSPSNEQHWISIGGYSSKAFGKLNNIDTNKVVFKGTGATLFKDNELVNPLIWGGASSYSAKFNPKSRTILKKVPRVSGTGSVLAASVCTRSNSRGTWYGSFEALSDNILNYDSSHLETMKRLILWSVSEYNVLTISSLLHQSIEQGGVASLNNDEQNNPSDYRVKDVIELELKLNEWDGNNWKGFETDDLQIEFVMLNPWVRTRLIQEKPGIFKTTIQVPDQIGVYKFKIEYVRKGVSSLFFEKVIPVRPYLHNEYERFIQMASPYYVASFSMMFAAFMLGLVILYGGDEGWGESRLNRVLEKSE